MESKVYPIKLGPTNCYLIRAETVILIDCGPKKKVREFLRRIEALSISPKDIRLIIITHGHWDHIGSARDIQAATGAKIMMHERERDRLEKSLMYLPPGITAWGRALSFAGKALSPFFTFPPARVDITVKNDDISLAEYGIPGIVLPTPGHTLGSISVLLAGGEAFVGDAAMNTIPFRLKPGLPILAEDEPRLRESWAKLKERGAKMIFPSHGNPFSMEKMSITG